MSHIRNSTNQFEPGTFESYGALLASSTEYNVKARDDLLNLLPPCSLDSIIEFGCADGTNLRHFMKALNIERGVGVDISNQAQLENNGISFYHTTIENFLEESKEKFDLVLLSDVLEHTYNPWKLLRKIKKLINNNGFLLISIPNIENLNYAGRFLSGNFYYEKTGLMDETHIRFFSKCTIEHYLTSAGYSVLRSAFREDSSLRHVKLSLLEKLSESREVFIRVNDFQVKIDSDNIDRKLGQQILILAKNA